MIKFAVRKYTEPGKMFRTKYKLSYSLRTNAQEIFPVGIEDVQGMIDSYRDGCDLNKIVQKVAIGDVSQLNVSPGFYGDISDMPMNLMDVLNARLEVNRLFDNLPDELQKKFGSVSEFLMSAGTDAWFEKLGAKLDGADITPPAPAEKEVSE